ARAGVAEAGDADDGVLPPRFADRPLRHAREGGAHLAADAEDDQVALQLRDVADRLRGGARQPFFEVFFRADQVAHGMPLYKANLPLLVERIWCNTGVETVDQRR